jgi:hypothetical protein
VKVELTLALKHTSQVGTSKSCRELIGLELQGQLSQAIGNLTNLQFLTISGNPGLSGHLPNEISNLNNLLKL